MITETNCFKGLAIISLNTNFNLNYYKMQEGKVKFFNNTKGFGFITPNDGGEDIFVHSTGLRDNIRENDNVIYDVERGQKGLSATNVRVA